MAYRVRPALPGDYELVAALRPSARPGDEGLSVVIEDDPATASWLLSAGATVKLEVVGLEGPLPGGVR